MSHSDRQTCAVEYFKHISFGVDPVGPAPPRERAPTMAEHIARIRPFQASDDKVVRLAIGKANMESLAVANRRGETDLPIICYMLTAAYVYYRLCPHAHCCYLVIVDVRIHPVHGYDAHRRHRLLGLCSTLPDDGCGSCSNHGFH